MRSFMLNVKQITDLHTSQRVQKEFTSHLEIFLKNLEKIIAPTITIILSKTHLVS
jgi:hypothetical protein